MAASAAAFVLECNTYPFLIGFGQIFGSVGEGAIAWEAHIGGFLAGWLLAPFVRRARRVYRPYYRDEGMYGFLPDGRRSGGGGPWG